jgi:hypothetical protein
MSCYPWTRWRFHPRRFSLVTATILLNTCNACTPLAEKLRADGIDAWIDQYVPNPGEGWPKWMKTQVERADRILLVFTETIAISSIRAKLGKSKVLSERSNSMLTIEDNEPVTFFVLFGNFSSSEFGVFHPVGLHYVHKQQIVCREIASAGVCSVCERIREMEKQGIPESQIFPIRGPLKYAMNVLVEGELSPLIFLATKAVGEEIIGTSQTEYARDGVNVFDPAASWTWTVTRSKRDGRAHYEVDRNETPKPIVTGEKAEEKIEMILKMAANLDERFKVP